MDINGSHCFLTRTGYVASQIMEIEGFSVILLLAFGFNLSEYLHALALKYIPNQCAHGVNVHIHVTKIIHMFLKFYSEEFRTLDLNLPVY